MPKIDMEAYNNAKAWEDMTEEERAEAEAEIASLQEENSPRVLSDGMTEEERSEEFTNYLIAARKKHTEQVDVPFPGFIGFSIDTAVPIYTADKPVQLDPAVYLLRGGEDINEACLYGASFDFQEMLDQINSGEIETEEKGDGTRVIKGEVTGIKGSVQRIEVEEGRPLLFLEALVFLAMKDAETEEQRRRIFSLGFVPKQAKEAEPLEEMASLVKQDTIKPRKQIDPNSKLANRITRPDLYSEAGALLDVSGRNEKGEVFTAVSLSYEGEGVSIAKQLTQFDREVHNAVTTLFVAGNKNVTIAQIWKQLSGMDEKPNPKQADTIRESIDKQRFTRVVVDYTAEARGRELQDMDGNPVTSFVIDDYVLNATRARIETANGREVEGYVINRPPALYEHSRALGQVISYPVKLLETSEAGQNTSENIVIKKYLLRRIGMLKGKSGDRLSPRIKYESVYKVAGYEGEGNPDKKQRKRINDYVLALMKLWKGEGAIKGYQEYKEGRTRAGVEVSI